jgi:hypothetical protein
METTEKIVEAYVRYVKHWATIPNVRCDGQMEIDLLAIDPLNSARYHIETSVSVSQGFSKLTAKEFDQDRLKNRVHQAAQRRTIGYFITRKFGSEHIKKKLSDYGFEKDQYKMIIVTWGWTQSAKAVADGEGILLWDFRNIVQEIADTISKRRSYFVDDTLRTIGLFSLAAREIS